MIGKVTTDTFFTVLKITEGENEEGKLVYPVSATPISIDGDETKVQVIEPSLVRSKNFQQTAKKTKRRVALDYDEQPDIEVKRVKMKLAYELLGERKKSEEKSGQKSEVKKEEGELKSEEKRNEQNREVKNGEKTQNEDKNAEKVNENDDKDKNENDKTKEEKYNDRETTKINDAEPLAEPSELSKNKDIRSQKEITFLQEPKSRDQYKQLSSTSKRRRSFAYNPALDFDSSDEKPPTNLKTHVYK